jgi:hypothetical protein
VFADFEIDELGSLYLVRISFDGYGCCNLDQKKEVTKISPANSATLIEYIENKEFSNPALIKVVINYLHEIREHIWPEALKDHGLL